MHTPSGRSRFAFSALPLAALLAACAGPEAKPMSMPGTGHIETRDVTYDVDGVPCKGFLAWDSTRTDRRPGVLVVHEWWGQTDYIRGRARMLAELGYTALAVDMYGEGRTAEHPADAQKFSAEVMAHLDVGEKRFLAARKLLAAQPTTDPDRIAAIGYCFGGGVVLHMARIGTDLRGVASFHGSLATQHPAKPGAIKAQIMVCHGADDTLVTKEQLDAFRQEMTAAGAELDIHVYAGAKHGFTNPAATEKGKAFGLPLAYDASADESSFAALVKFLAGVCH